MDTYVHMLGGQLKLVIEHVPDLKYNASQGRSAAWFSCALGAMVKAMLVAQSDLEA